MKKSLTYSALFLMLFMAISLVVGGSAAVAQDEPPVLPHYFTDPMPGDWPDEPGAMPEPVGGQKPDRPLVFVEKREIVRPQATNGPSIDVWYGNTQKFGHKGNPQEWVNIVGNVSDLSGIKSLVYKLNGGAERPLSMGTSNKRLIALGDFNIEFAYSELNPGANTVEIIAKNNNDEETKTNVTVNYTAGVTWPSNYTANWGASTDIQDIAQVVDGNWSIQGGKLVPLDIGYDRLVAFGDETWTDYEVVMPFTVKAIDPAGFARGGPGIGLIVHWLGHNQTPGAPPEQPLLDWERVGGIGWYRWASNSNEGLELRGRNWNKGISSDEVLEFNVPYFLKMSVQGSSTPGDERGYYRLKMWKQGESEPVTWNKEGWSDTTAMKSGSVVVVAHFVDVEVGNVQVKNLDGLSYTVTTSAIGNGSVVVEPKGVTEFKYGERAFIRAFPDSGYTLEGWSGDYTGSDNPLIVLMTKDINVTATFVQAPPGSLTVNVVGEGTVKRSPDKPIYDGGEEVTLTATPKPGHKFVEWSGDLTGNLNPAIIQIAGNKTVTAKFMPAEEDAPFSDNFNRCELNTDLWTIVNPAGDGSVIVDNGIAKLSVPAGPAHTMYLNNRDAVRIMQDAENEDFLLQAKFDSIPQSRYQIEGILVEQDNNNWIRFDLFNDGSQVFLFTGNTIAGVWEAGDIIPVDVGGASSIYLRVNRIGDIWTASYSLNGADWTPMDPFVKSLLVAKVGVLVGNEPEGTAPAFAALVDYFWNVSNPAGGGYTITVDEVGQGTVKLTPDSGSYVCGEEVEVEAVPESGWNFINWSGDASGSTNPFKVTMTADKSYTATFLREGQEILSYLPAIMRP